MHYRKATFCRLLIVIETLINEKYASKFVLLIGHIIVGGFLSDVSLIMLPQTFMQYCWNLIELKNSLTDDMLKTYLVLEFSFFLFFFKGSPLLELPIPRREKDNSPEHCRKLCCIKNKNICYYSRMISSYSRPVNHCGSLLI